METTPTEGEGLIATVDHRASPLLTLSGWAGVFALAAVTLLNAGACGGKGGSPSSPTPPPGQRRSTVDRPDDVLGDQVHVMYVLPSDGVDQRLDSDGTVDAAIQLARDWVVAQTNNSRRVRFDTYQGALDITFFQSGRSDTEYVSLGVRIREALAADLAAAGFSHPRKIYALFYGGGSSSSGAQIACAQSGRPGSLSAVYVGCLLERSDIQALIAVHGLPKILGIGMIHEVFHALGAVPDCAPHQIAAGHASDDPRDIMVTSLSAQLASFRDPGFLPLLDAGRDDYYAHTNRGCLDLADSTFLERTTQSALTAATGAQAGLLPLFGRHARLQLF